MKIPRCDIDGGRERDVGLRERSQDQTPEREGGVY